MTHITVKRSTPMPLINDDDPPSKFQSFRIWISKRWTVRKIFNPLAFHICRFFIWAKLAKRTTYIALLAIFVLVLHVAATAYFLKAIVISVAPWTYVRTAHAAEVKHKPLTIEDYICTKDWDCKTAVAVAKAESGLRCDAQNVNKGTNSLDLGVMQINSVHLKKGWKVADLLDCHKNVDLAYEIYKGSGWGAWSTYKNGSYKKQL